MRPQFQASIYVSVQDWQGLLKCRWRKISEDTGLRYRTILASRHQSGQRARDPRQRPRGSCLSMPHVGCFVKLLLLGALARCPQIFARLPSWLASQNFTFDFCISCLGAYQTGFTSSLRDRVRAKNSQSWLAVGLGWLSQDARNPRRARLASDANAASLQDSGSHGGLKKSRNYGAPRGPAWPTNGPLRGSAAPTFACRVTVRVPRVPTSNRDSYRKVARTIFRWWTSLP